MREPDLEDPDKVEEEVKIEEVPEAPKPVPLEKSKKEKLSLRIKRKRNESQSRQPDIGANSSSTKASAKPLLHQSESSRSRKPSDLPSGSKAAILKK